ncbi:MAG TPA: VOC family protein [Chloroflexia bacterium]|nr:VOC family protein [Chloroflexia bacterium]
MIQGLNFVMLHVPDVAEARAFFVDKLGLELEDDTPGFLQFKATHGGAALGVGQPPPGAAEGAELWWFVDDADAAHADLVAKGVTILEPPADQPFGRSLAIRGPGGQALYLLQLPAHG